MTDQWFLRMFIFDFWRFGGLHSTGRRSFFRGFVIQGSWLISHVGRWLPILDQHFVDSLHDLFFTLKWLSSFCSSLFFFANGLGDREFLVCHHQHCRASQIRLSWLVIWYGSRYIHTYIYTYMHTHIRNIYIIVYMHTLFTCISTHPPSVLYD